MPHSRLAVASVLLAAWSTAAYAAMGSVEVERFVTALSSAERRQELGLKSVRRPSGIVNRLDVVFEDHVHADERTATLQQIGREFLRVIFEREGISTVTMLERDDMGRIVNQTVVRMGARLGLLRRLARC